MGSHSVTCHPTEVRIPPLPQPKQVLDLVTLEGCKAELTYVTWKRTDWELNPWPVNRKSNTLPLSHHATKRQLKRRQVGSWTLQTWQSFKQTSFVWMSPTVHMLQCAVLTVDDRRLTFLNAACWCLCWGNSDIIRLYWCWHTDIRWFQFNTQRPYHSTELISINIS